MTHLHTGLMPLPPALLLKTPQAAAADDVKMLLCAGAIVPCHDSRMSMPTLCHDVILNSIAQGWVNLQARHSVLSLELLWKMRHCLTMDNTLSKDVKLGICA